MGERDDLEGPFNLWFSNTYEVSVFPKEWLILPNDLFFSVSRGASLSLLVDLHCLVASLRCHSIICYFHKAKVLNLPYNKAMYQNQTMSASRDKSTSLGVTMMFCQFQLAGCQGITEFHRGPWTPDRITKNSMNIPCIGSSVNLQAVIIATITMEYALANLCLYSCGHFWSLLTLNVLVCLMIFWYTLRQWSSTCWEKGGERNTHRNESAGGSRAGSPKEVQNPTLLSVSVRVPVGGVHVAITNCSLMRVSYYCYHSQ